MNQIEFRCGPPSWTRWLARPIRAGLCRLPGYAYVHVIGVLSVQAGKPVCGDERSARRPATAVRTLTYPCNLLRIVMWITRDTAQDSLSSTTLFCAIRLCGAGRSRSFSFFHNTPPNRLVHLRRRPYPWPDIARKRVLPLRSGWSTAKWKSLFFPRQLRACLFHTPSLRPTRK